MKRNKGITLIALIITIIVLLILVAVSVQVLIKSNLIGAAEKTTNKYKTAAEDEKNLDAKIENGKSLDDYLEDAGIITEVHNWKREGDSITCEHCNSNFTIGETALKYEPNTDKTSTVLTHEQSGYTIREYTDEKWIDQKADQTINREEVEWVVLGIDDKDNNGIYETLLITTQTPVTTSATRLTSEAILKGKYIDFEGEKAYTNGPEQLNRISRELYSNSEYGNARSITRRDIIQCFELSEDIEALTGNYYFLSINKAENKLMINNDTKTFDISENAIKLICGDNQIWNFHYWTADSEQGKLSITGDRGSELENNWESGYRYSLSAISSNFEYSDWRASINKAIFAGFRPVVELRNKIPETYSAPAVVTKSLDFQS